MHFVQLQEGDEDQYGEVRDEGSDDSEGEEADESSTLTANVSLICFCRCHRRAVVLSQGTH